MSQGESLHPVTLKGMKCTVADAAVMRMCRPRLGASVAPALLTDVGAVGPEWDALVDSRLHLPQGFGCVVRAWARTR